ncbi:hypothetical protein ACWD7F_36265, partial [Streptomyces sp. NPDC005122]
QRLERITSHEPPRDNDASLRERLDHLTDATDDPRAAELRREAHEAATEQDAKETFDKLEQYLSRREQERRQRVRDLTNRLEQLQNQHTDQLLTGHTPDAKDNDEPLPDQPDTPHN